MADSNFSSESVMENAKKELRKKAKKALSSVSEVQCSQWSYRICQNIFDSGILDTHDVFLAFYPSKKEVDIVPVLKKILSEGKRLALPVCNDSFGHMEFRLISEKTGLEESLKEGMWKIMEPDILKTEALDLSALENKKVLCLVPGLVFSKEGFRLGKGKGYYDRFFSELEKNNLSAEKVGVCFEMMMAGSENSSLFSEEEIRLASESHDVKLDALVTERRIVFVPIAENL